MEYDKKRYRKRDNRSNQPIDTALPYYINKAIKTALNKKSFAEQRIITDWPLIVGSKYASYSYPAKIIFPSQYKNNGYLHVIATNGGVAMQIQYSQPVIIEKISSYFGYQLISRIIIHQQPDNFRINKAPIAKDVFVDKESKDEAISSVKKANIADDDINSILERLAIEVLKDNKNKKS